MKIKNLFKGEGFVNFSSSILAIVCGLLFGLIILLISNPSQAFGGFMMIIQGGFRMECRDSDMGCIWRKRLLLMEFS